MSARYSKQASQSAASSKAKLVAGVLAAIAVAGVAWWLTRPPVQLTEDHYAATVALYRVCNQRSDTGLDQIEALLATFASEGQPDESSDQALQAIVADARQGRWQRATVNCRRLLEDQVQR